LLTPRDKYAVDIFASAVRWQMLFASDPWREAIFLVAGDKFGNWDGWYRKAVPLADERLAWHLAELEAEEEAGKR
jgi:hypothetical protein